MRKKINRYQTYNKHRKLKAFNFHRGTATLLFKITPYLLHCNYPDLPGFIEDPECPYGIYRFIPEKVVDPELFSRYFPDSTARRYNTPSPYSRKPCIHSLKTIGSIGTIAQSEKSDCDYWISVRYEEIGAKGLQRLNQKCRAIEKWSMDAHHLELHFFIMDIDQTRENKFDSAAEEESAGSALKILLKDELFRTHILVAGKMLLWWLIPPGLTDKEYQTYVAALIEKKQLNPDNFVDLGYISDIPKAEIFGACLWQLNKALDSPFKSVIKFAYLELLLKYRSKILSLFSTKIQCLVTFPNRLPKGEIKLPLTHIDPYLLLAKDIVAFYQKNKIKDEDTLIRECLFFKTLEGTKTKDRHLETTMALMNKWDLLPPDYERMIKWHRWKYHELLSFGTRVHAYLLDTYNRLRWLRKSFQNETGHTISDRDLSILGKKLFSFYQEKPNKISYLRTISRQAMEQSDITFHVSRYNNVIYYYVFQGKLATEKINISKESQIKRDTDPIHLILWLVMNGIVQKQTNIHLTKNFLSVYLSDLQRLATIIIKTFPLFNFSNVSAEDLLRKETMTMALVIVNFEKLQVKGSQELHSSIITVNTYGEHFLHHYTTHVQLKNAMRLLLTQHFVSRWNNNLELYIPEQPEQYYLQTLLES